jgi:Homing endonuclease associated repeat
MTSVRPAQASSLRRTAGSPGPVAYRPMAHPGRPRRWSRAAILAALRAWSQETGRPPRRDDWSGERPGEAGRAQRKWMREHPRWPSSSCVAGHFGSWSAALEAAELPARRLTFDSSVTERVDEARRLAAGGLGARRISVLLGVSVSSVHNYLRARRCPDCGGPVTNPTAGRCAGCAGREPTVTRAWTRDDVRAALRRWQAEHGSAPSYRDWTPSRQHPGRWEAESPRWPSAAVVCELYRQRPDPWNATLRDAGAAIRVRRWTDESVRSALAGFWVQTGRAPGRPDLADGDWPGPHPRTLRRRYGGVAAAWSALGPAPDAGRPRG